MFASMDLGVTNDRQRTGGEQAAQITIAPLGDVTELFLATAGVLFGHQSNPGRKVPSRSEGFRVGNAGNERGRQYRPDAWYLI